MRGIGWDYTELHKAPKRVFDREFNAATNAVVALNYLVYVNENLRADAVRRLRALWDVRRWRGGR